VYPSYVQASEAVVLLAKEAESFEDVVAAKAYAGVQVLSKT